MKQKRKTNFIVHKNSDIDLNKFSLGDSEIAAELSATERKKILASYELDKLINQSGDEGSLFINRKKRLIFTHSPHLLNLQNAKSKRAQVQAQSKVALPKVKSTMLLAKHVNLNQLFGSLSRIAVWRAPKFSFKFPNLFKLSIIQLIYSLLQLFRIFYESLKYGFAIVWRTFVEMGSGVYKLFQKTTAASKLLSSTAAVQYSRSLLVFIIIAVVLMLPYFGLGIYNSVKVVHGRVLGISQEGARSWQSGFDSMLQGNWDEAVNGFNEASLDFANAQVLLHSYIGILDRLPEWMSVDSTEIGSGINIIEIGSVMSDISIKLNQVAALTTSESASLGDKLSVLATNLNEIEILYSSVASKLAKLDIDIIPADYKDIFAIWQAQAKPLVGYLEELNDNLQWLMSLIGSDSPKRYLLVFQNNNELRATGGFMGSFALLDMNKGDIENLNIPGGGLYDLAGQVQKFVVAPYPHQLLGSRWQIWDANWWSDWPTTAKKIAWFYESAGGPSVDGVIAVNSQLLIDLVGIFEPIMMPDYNKELTSSNVVTALQHAVEFEYDKVENKPKQILADLAPLLIDKIYELPPAELFSMAQVLYKHLERENIQLYLFDENMQNRVEQKTWSGKVPRVIGDYLQVVVQNIGGGKSDEAIQQTVDYNLLVGPDNYLIAKATVIRKHQGAAGDVFTGHRNVAFIRLLTPVGSELISIDGAVAPDERLFEQVIDSLDADEDLIELDGINYYKDFGKFYTTKQFDKQVFGQWLMVDPGETKEITFVYRLPFEIAEDKSRSRLVEWLLPEQYKLNYSLYYDKQSGMDDQNFRFSFTMPNILDSKWFADSLDCMYKIGKSLYAESIINSDYQLGFILR